MDDITQPIGPPVPQQPGVPAPVPLASRLLRTVLVGAGGLVLLVAGLVWDALLHARDPGLAAKEGITQPIGPPVPQQPGTATPGHTHGPNLPEVAAATPDERARAEALWKASVANAERWRDPAAASSTRPARRHSSTGTGPATGWPWPGSCTPRPGGQRTQGRRADHPVARPRVLPGPGYRGQAGPARGRRLPPGPGLPAQRRDDARLVRRRPGHRLRPPPTPDRVTCRHRLAGIA